VTVDEGAGVYPPAEVLVIVADAEEEEDKNPLQKPWLQVLKAHCWSLVHWAWKLPHTVLSMELTA
jgi:hypothetical protein